MDGNRRFGLPFVTIVLKTIGPFVNEKSIRVSGSSKKGK